MNTNYCEKCGTSWITHNDDGSCVDENGEIDNARENFDKKIKLAIEERITLFCKDRDISYGHGLIRKTSIIRSHLKYPTTTNIEYNNSLNSFQSEWELVSYILDNGIETQR